MQLDQRVRVKSNVNGLIKWLPGKVTKVCGSRTYLIHMYNNGRTRFVHIDHILGSQEKGVPESSNSTYPLIDLQVPVEYPVQRDTGLVKHSRGQHERCEQKQTHSETEIVKNQFQPNPDAQGKADDQTTSSPVPVFAPVPSPEVSLGRRYPMRVRKAPVKLNL